MRFAIAWPLAFSLGIGAATGFYDLCMLIQEQQISGWRVFLGFLAIVALLGLIFDILQGRARGKS